jgi:hypothetical protein
LLLLLFLGGLCLLLRVLLVGLHAPCIAEVDDVYLQGSKYNEKQELVINYMKLAQVVTLARQHITEQVQLLVTSALHACTPSMALHFPPCRAP